jgi:hypothetical protein
MSCKVCKIELAKDDKHFGCLRHRECTRQSPCSLDINEPDVYWDEVEALLSSVSAVSPVRRASMRNVNASSEPRSTNEPPPLAPLTAQGLKSREVAKKPKKSTPRPKSKSRASKPPVPVSDGVLRSEYKSSESQKKSSSDNRGCSSQHGYSDNNSQVSAITTMSDRPVGHPLTVIDPIEHETVPEYHVNEGGLSAQANSEVSRPISSVARRDSDISDKVSNSGMIGNPRQSAEVSMIGNPRQSAEVSFRQPITAESFGNDRASVVSGNDRASVVSGNDRASVVSGIAGSAQFSSPVLARFGYCRVSSAISRINKTSE